MVNVEVVAGGLGLTRLAKSLCWPNSTSWPCNLSFNWIFSMWPTSSSLGTPPTIHVSETCVDLVFMSDTISRSFAINCFELSLWSCSVHPTQLDGLSSPTLFEPTPRCNLPWLIGKQSMTHFFNQLFWFFIKQSLIILHLQL